ncbi:hypothetical protein EhV164_00001, partial [Emiliania huxleyi virus 164]
STEIKIPTTIMALIKSTKNFLGLLSCLNLVITANTRSLILIRQGNKREFRLSMRPLNDYPKTYGCFKGHLRVRKGLGALLKLLYVTGEQIDSACYLPTQLLKRITPMSYAIPLDDQRGVQVHQLLKGTSAHLLEEFEQLVDENPFRDRFTNKYFASEVEHLRLFFELGPARNQLMKRELNLDSEIIPQDQLDDLQVLLVERVN